ncbi:hypothetical protein P7C70_g1432, partial [Phenoliferia sp. Uapishka_3]
MQEDRTPSHLKLNELPLQRGFNSICEYIAINHQSLALTTASIASHFAFLLNCTHRDLTSIIDLVPYNSIVHQTAHAISTRTLQTASQRIAINMDAWEEGYTSTEISNRSYHSCSNFPIYSATEIDNSTNFNPIPQAVVTVMDADTTKLRMGAISLALVIQQADSYCESINEIYQALKDEFHPLFLADKRVISSESSLRINSKIESVASTLNEAQKLKSTLEARKQGLLARLSYIDNSDHTLFNSALIPLRQH